MFSKVIVRDTDRAVARALGFTSLKLEHLAASFLVDADHFFSGMEPNWQWSNLTWLVITSNLFTPDVDNTNDIGDMLRGAAAAAMNMPRLETLEIWNGRKRFAGLFKYQPLRDTRKGRITWRGTWELAIGPSVVEAWAAVVRQKYDEHWSLELVQERLDEAVIKSHADAIERLMLSGQVIRPVSLQQIRGEQEALAYFGVDVQVPAQGFRRNDVFLILDGYVMEEERMEHPVLSSHRPVILARELPRDKIRTGESVADLTTLPPHTVDLPTREH